MTNKPNTDKTIQQIRDELANKTYPMQVVNGADWNTSLRVGFNTGFDAALKICEQRERDLLKQIYKVQCTGPNQKEVLKELYRLADLYDQKHRGENE